jgi:hypothetical protein
MLAFVPMPTAIADVFVIGEDGIGSLEECLRRNESNQIVTHRAAAAVTGEGKAVPVCASTFPFCTMLESSNGEMK